MDIKKNQLYKLGLECKDCDRTKYPLLNNARLEIQGREIIHAIITCGMPGIFLNYEYTKKRIKEIIYKKLMLESILDENYFGYLCRSDSLYNLLDQSEKSCISYYYGMIFTKLISKKVFDVPILIHLSMMEKRNPGIITYKGVSNNRPDLIGYNPTNHEWSVWEAKGDKSGLKKALVQLNVINTINMKTPSIKAACGVYFDEFLNVRVIDPIDKGNLDIIIDTYKLLESYYISIYELMENRKIGNKNGITSVHLNLFNTRMVIGLPDEIFDYFKKQKTEGFDIIVNKYMEQNLRQKFVGSDLVYLK